MELRRKNISLLGGKVGMQIPETQKPEKDLL